MAIVRTFTFAMPPVGPTASRAPPAGRSRLASSSWPHKQSQCSVGREATSPQRGAGATCSTFMVAAALIGASQKGSFFGLRTARWKAGRVRPRSAAGARIRRFAGETIEQFRVFGPEDDPFEIEVDEVLGRGSQGTVYLCKRQKDPSQLFAVKAVPIWMLQERVGAEVKNVMDPESARIVAAMDKELEIMTKVQGHANVASCVGCWDVPHPLGPDAMPALYKMMVMELMRGGELAEFIAENGKLDEDVALNVFKQTVAGVEFLHNTGVLHRDLKCENILVCSDQLTRDSEVKLFDFGVAKVLEDSFTRTCVGTVSIMAPELLCAKMMVAPGGNELSTFGPVVFSPPQEMSPGFGLITQNADGTGCLINGVDSGGQAEKKNVCDGWALKSINGTDVTKLQFVPDIVGILQSLSSDFEIEFVKLPKREFGKPADLWSLGVVLFTMLAGVAPFAETSDIVSGKYKEGLIAHTSEAAKDLVRNLLQLSPSERATIEQVKQHPWMARAN